MKIRSAKPNRWQADSGQPACRIDVLPRWEDVIGYEERDPYLAQLQLGYPRFLIHPYVLELAAQLNPDANRLALPFPLKLPLSVMPPLSAERTRMLPWIFSTRRSTRALSRCRSHRTQSVATLRRRALSRQAEALLNQRLPKIQHPMPRRLKINSPRTQTDPDDILLFPSGMAALCAASAFQQIHPQRNCTIWLSLWRHP